MSDGKKEEFIEKLMDEFVQFAYCDSCSCRCCAKYEQRKAKRECFNNHPGWVTLAPHNIKQVLENIVKKYQIKEAEQ